MALRQEQRPDKEEDPILDVLDMLCNGSQRQRALSAAKEDVRRNRREPLQAFLDIEGATLSKDVSCSRPYSELVGSDFAVELIHLLATTLIRVGPVSAIPAKLVRHHRGVTDDVATLWRNIVDWLEHNTPPELARLRLPASDTLIAEVEAAVGKPLPDDIRQWWKLTDGVSRRGTEVIPPSFTPLPCAAALDAQQLQLSFMADEPDRGEDDGLHGAAGESTYYFHRLFLPIADDPSGDLLCIDLRSGPREGCIIRWDHQGGWQDEFLWENVGDMLRDICNAMLHGRPALSAYAGRHARYFAGYDIDSIVWRTEVSSEMELAWSYQETGSGQMD
jgi:cell wall assembly regulator SMI1